MSTGQNGTLGGRHEDLDPDLYEVPSCPICGSERRTALYESQKRTGTDLGDVQITVSQCDACGFLYNAPRVSEVALRAYYRTSKLASGQVYRDESAQGYYPKLNARRAGFLAKFLKHRPGGKFLDIGCGVGGFLDAVKDQGLDGWQLCGLEPSEHAHAQATAKGYEVYNAPLGGKGLPEQGFDAISMISVLEHMTDPKWALDSIRKLLKPDGLVMIEVPNTLHPQLSLSGFFSLEHIQHFTPYSLTELFKAIGWNQVQNDPGENGHALRLIGSTDLASWGQAADEPLVSDKAQSVEVLKAYAEQESRFLDMLNRRVKQSFDDWHAKGKTIGIYGAGVHTAALTSYFDLLTHASFILDGDVKKQGDEFMGLPVHAPEDIPKLGINAVLVSSQRFQDEIERKVREVGGPDVSIAVCYDDPNNTLAEAFGG